MLIEQFTDMALGLADTALLLRSGLEQYSGPAGPLGKDPALLKRAYFGL